MKSEPRTEIVRGPMVWSFGGGVRWTYERTITTVDDWGEIKIGDKVSPINWGYVSFGPQRIVKLET